MNGKYFKIIAFILSVVLVFTSVLTACGTEPRVADFYVKYGGTGDGLTTNTPAGSVNAVKNAINKKLSKGDIANVWLMQSEAEDFNVYAFADGEKTNVMNVWKNSAEENVAHTAKIVVKTYIPKDKSAEDVPKAYMAFSEKVAANSVLELTGPTELDNIIIVPTATTDKINLAGNDITYGKDISFRCIDAKEGDSIADWKEVNLAEHQPDFTTVLADGDKVIENEVNVNFDNLPFNCGEFYIPSNEQAKAEFKEDVTIYYNKENLANFRLTLGGAQSTENGYSAHFYKNLNVKMKKGDAIKIWPGKSDILVDGGAQFIVDPKTTYYKPNDKEYSFANIATLKSLDESGKATDAKKWILYIDSKEQDYIDFASGKTGEFVLKDGYKAVATTKDGKSEIISKGKTLVLKNAGEYNVTVTEKYTNNGETIKVYKGTEIDLGKVSHTEKDGYAFVGWKTEKGKYPKRTQKYSKGTVLTAEYLPIEFCVSENKIVEGAGGEHDLVFVFNKSKEFYNGLPKALEYGSIYLPSDATLGAQMYINEPIVYTWKWNKETGLDFEPSGTGRTPIRNKSWNVKNEESKGDANEYTLTIEDVDQDNYYTWYSVRGYIIYEDYNGLQRIVYSVQDNPDFEKGSNYDNDQSCIYEIAEETPDDKKGELERKIIEYVQGGREDYYHQATGIIEYYSGYKGMGLKDENPLNKLYKLSNGITVRDVTIATGKNTQKTEICFITDPHFATLDKKDINENITNALASYRGRSWTREKTFRNTSLTYMEYASMFDKTVVGGDAVDYLTYGSIGSVSRLFTKKSVNGSIKMVLGNHEPAEMSQNDIGGLSMQNSVEDRYQLLTNNWTNDVEYSSEIMKTGDGKDNLMLIYLDNGGKKGYNENQLKKFKADIAVARQKDLPVLIFQHIPLGTEETNYKDEVSINLYNEIKKSSDVVKGIFCGHIHEHSLTYLNGLNQDGSENGVKIPQYSGSGAHYNNVMKITVK